MLLGVGSWFVDPTLKWLDYWFFLCRHHMTQGKYSFVMEASREAFSVQWFFKHSTDLCGTWHCEYFIADVLKGDRNFN